MQIQTGKLFFSDPTTWRFGEPRQKNLARYSDKELELPTIYSSQTWKQRILLLWIQRRYQTSSTCISREYRLYPYRLWARRGTIFWSQPAFGRRGNSTDWTSNESVWKVLGLWYIRTCSFLCFIYFIFAMTQSKSREIIGWPSMFEKHRNRTPLRKRGEVILDEWMMLFNTIASSLCPGPVIAKVPSHRMDLCAHFGLSNRVILGFFYSRWPPEDNEGNGNAPGLNCKV